MTRAPACLLFVLLAAGASAAAAPGAIRVNQLGFSPQAHKVAVLPAGAGGEVQVIDAASGALAWRGRAKPAATWKESGEAVMLADFSALTRPGEYRIRADGAGQSERFAVRAGVYSELNRAALKAFYFNRSGMALDADHAGPYARAAGHPDTRVLVHASAASKARPEGTVIASAKGWYDAGDYNKYIVNSGISTYTLLAAFEHYPGYFARKRTGIPESGNRLPDILDEALWNLEWMLTMQDPHDGGVYNKLTNERFDGIVMPAQASAEPRYVVRKGTAATLDFAATMATAARVLKPYERQLPGLPAKMLRAAEAAWEWARANPAVAFRNPAGVVTGEYGDASFDDEFAWAAAELYISSGKDSYYAAMQPAGVTASVPQWADVRALAWISLAHHRNSLSAVADRKLIAARVDGLAASLAATWRSSAYGVPMQGGDFVWGSNAVALNQSMMLLQAYRLNGKRDYLDAAQAGLDYILGRNATGYAFVTGFGTRQVMHPHHRPSMAGKVAAPVPGFLAGGPHAGQQDKGDCKAAYPSALPALSYIDDDCSYASNEVAINWNAPLVYVSAALDVLGGAGR
ncbi:cellulase [Massilia sp. CCM 8733]|uniref:Endoglucanase n=1 Tax=Massilia mucilaginosa TaxID=2609282 RepID=A0ABX0NMR0_9BURK|nr:glycoside hydrolase family 9 protein [Massilia mucilaginosa]NHZ88048.1 cellulase [Massilia mucilaginosa]